MDCITDLVGGQVEVFHGRVVIEPKRVVDDGVQEVGLSARADVREVGTEGIPLRANPVADDAAIGLVD